MNDIINAKTYVSCFMGDVVYARYDKQTVRGNIMELYPYFFTFHVIGNPDNEMQGYTVSFSYQDILSGAVLLGRKVMR